MAPSSGENAGGTEGRGVAVGGVGHGADGKGGGGAEGAEVGGAGAASERGGGAEGVGGCAPTRASQVSPVGRWPPLEEFGKAP